MQLYRQRHKTAHKALQWRFLRFATFFSPRYQTDTSGYNAACATLDGIQATGRLAPIPDTSATPDAVQVSTAAYYNKVYKGASLLWIHARQCSTSHTMQARRGQLLPYADRWQVLRPAHLLRDQRLQLYKVIPAAVSMLPTPGGLRSGTGSAVRTGSLASYTRRGSPAAGARRAARNYWRLSPQLFRAFAR